MGYPLEYKISSDGRFGSAFMAKLILSEDGYDLEFCPIVEGNKYSGTVLIEESGYYIYRYYAGSRKYHFQPLLRKFSMFLLEDDDMLKFDKLSFDPV
mgnify:CR=1 FL=1